jgi:hypothetical protein
MAKAAFNDTTNLSSMIRDPYVREAFARAERDGLAPAAAVNTGDPRILDGGALASRELVEA